MVYHLCNSDERVRNYEQKKHGRSSSENSGKCDDYRKLRFFSLLKNEKKEVQK